MPNGSNISLDSEEAKEEDARWVILTAEWHLMINKVRSPDWPMSRSSSSWTRSRVVDENASLREVGEQGYMQMEGKLNVIARIQLKK